MKNIYNILKGMRYCKPKTVHSKLWTLNSLVIAFCCLLTTVNSQAQIFPVNVNVVAMPPYSMYLNDYGMGSNLQVNVVQREINAIDQEAYLNIELEGAGIRLKTLSSFRPTSYVDIFPNAMLTLSNVDLAEYLSPNALSFEGISRESFLANAQQLPEGLYKLKVKVLYKLNGMQASNEAMTLMSLQKGQPPLINQPTHKGKVPENPTQSFIIQWTNRNMGGGWMIPPSYRIQMWEMLDPSQDPNIIVNSSYPPILDDYTNFSTYQHGMANTSLVAGKSYALRVQIVDPEGRDVYTNGGYSQVCVFTYGDPCDPPSNLKATKDSRGILVNWSAVPGNGYHLQYSRIDTAWQETETFINNFQIEKIYPSAQYRMQVATLCSGGKQSAYSEIVYFSSPPSGSNNQAACGDPFPKIEFKSKTLLPSLSVGDKFTAYDFDVTVTRVHRNDSTSYKGEGTTPFNMLGGVNTVVYFDGIKINTDRQLIDGAVKFQQKPYVFSDKNIKQFKEDFKDSKEMITGNDAASPETVNVDVTIGTVVYDSTKKQIVINDVSGDVHKTLTSGKDYKITDKDGNVYLVSKDNQITKQPKATESTVKNGGPSKDGGLNTDLYFVEDQAVLKFSAHPQQTWAFDAMELNSMGDQLYENVRNNDEAYYVPYKSIGAAGTDKVTAKLYANPKNVDLKRIKFKTNDGVAVPFSYDASKQEWELTLTAGLHRNDFSVFPYYGNGKDKDTLCGKLNVMPLDRKEVNLVLVPLNGYKGNISASDVEGYLNKVYNQANIAYKVSMDGAFSTTAADQPLSVEHGKLEGEYSANQANVITDYQIQYPEQDNTLYLFLCKQGSNEVVKGHTPVNRSYGFLFGETVDKRTIAHEVGHGYPLALEHSFADGGTTGTYSNLMDYNSSTNLSFKQWDLAHNKKLKVRFGQDAKQGELNVSELEQLFDWLVNNRGKKVKYDKSAYKTYDSWNTFIKYGYDGGKSGLYVELNGSGDVDLDTKYIEVGIDRHSCGANFTMSFMRPNRSGEFIRIWTASYSSYEVLLKRLGLRLTDVTKAEVIAEYKNLLSTSGKGCNDIDIIYQNIPLYVLDKIRYADKIEAIETLLACGLDKFCVDEYAAVFNLIGSIKDTEIDRFIIELTQKKLFERLYNMLGASDAEKLVGILTEKFYRSKSYQPNLDNVTRNNSFLYEAVTQNKGRNYELDLAGDHYDGRYLTGGFTAGKMNDDDFKLGLFQTVLVVSKLELPYVNMARKGNGLYIAKVPAIYVKMLINRQVQSTVAQGTKMVIEAVGTAFTLYTGTGMLRAPSLLARIVGAADVASGLTGAGILTYKGIVEQKYGRNSDRYHLMEQVENIVNLYNACRFAVELVQLPTLVDKAGKLWNAEKAALKQEKVMTNAEFDKVDELLGDGKAVTTVTSLSNLEKSIISSLTARGFSISAIDDIMVRAMYIDDVLGNNRMMAIIDDLSKNPKFKNPEDLFSNLDVCMKKIKFNNKKISSADVDNLKVNSLLNEFEEGQYWTSRGEDVFISKSFTPGNKTSPNEVDVTLLTRQGIVECKYANVETNAESNVYGNLENIISKFKKEEKLQSIIKDQYPRRYGQIKIENGSFQNLINAEEFVRSVKSADITGNIKGLSKFTLEELKSLEELHLIINNRRIIVRPSDW